VSSTPTPAPTPPPTFAQQISNSDSLQLIGVIANCSGIISSALAIYSFFDGYGQPDNATLLNAITSWHKHYRTISTSSAT
jgi:hypothetical protein